MTIGQKIKEVRKARGISQLELGTLLGVSQAMVAQYESGIRNPKIETLQKIAAVLGVDASDLYAFGIKTDQGTKDRSAFYNILRELGYIIEYRNNPNDTVSWALLYKGVHYSVTYKELEKLKDETIAFLKYHIHEVVSCADKVDGSGYTMA